MSLAGPAATLVPWNFAPTIERLTFGWSLHPHVLLQQRALHAHPQVALALHVDNKIVVGGAFTTFQATGDAGVTERNRIARLNPNGTVDSEFNPNANNGVTTLAVQRDGKIVLGGAVGGLLYRSLESTETVARLPPVAGGEKHVARA